MARLANYPVIKMVSFRLAEAPAIDAGYDGWRVVPWKVDVVRRGDRIRMEVHCRSLSGPGYPRTVYYNVSGYEYSYPPDWLEDLWAEVKAGGGG